MSIAGDRRRHFTNASLRLAIVVLVACVIGAALGISARVVFAFPGPTEGWTWDSSLTMKTRNAGTNYGAYISSAASDTDSLLAFASDGFDVQFCTIGCNVHFGQGTFGTDFPIARAYPKSNGASCYTGPSRTPNLNNCNDTTKRVDQGTIQYNLSFTSELNALPHPIARHELGHFLGLAHPTSCNTATLMMGLDCHPNTTFPTTWSAATTDAATLLNLYD